MSEQKGEMTDLQQQADAALRHLVSDLLNYVKEIAPYTYAAAPRCIDLRDRAAQLGIVIEITRQN